MAKIEKRKIYTDACFYNMKTPLLTHCVCFQIDSFARHMVGWYIYSNVYMMPTSRGRAEFEEYWNSVYAFKQRYFLSLPEKVKKKRRKVAKGK